MILFNLFFICSAVLMEKSDDVQSSGSPASRIAIGIEQYVYDLLSGVYEQAENIFITKAPRKYFRFHFNYSTIFVEDRIKEEKKWAEEILRQDSTLKTVVAYGKIWIRRLDADGILEDVHKKATRYTRKFGRKLLAKKWVGSSDGVTKKTTRKVNEQKVEEVKESETPEDQEQNEEQESDSVIQQQSQKNIDSVISAHQVARLFLKERNPRNPQIDKIYGFDLIQNSRSNSIRGYPKKDSVDICQPLARTAYRPKKSARSNEIYRYMWTIGIPYVSGLSGSTRLFLNGLYYLNADRIGADVLVDSIDVCSEIFQADTFYFKLVRSWMAYLVLVDNQSLYEVIEVLNLSCAGMRHQHDSTWGEADLRMLYDERYNFKKEEWDIVHLNEETNWDHKMTDQDARNWEDMVKNFNEIAEREGAEIQEVRKLHNLHHRYEAYMWYNLILKQEHTSKGIHRISKEKILEKYEQHLQKHASSSQYLFTQAGVKRCPIGYSGIGTEIACRDAMAAACQVDTSRRVCRDVESGWFDPYQPAKLPTGCFWSEQSGNYGFNIGTGSHPFIGLLCRKDEVIRPFAQRHQ